MESPSSAIHIRMRDIVQISLRRKARSNSEHLSLGMNNEELFDLMYSDLYELSDEAIYKMRDEESGASINNVVDGLEKQSIGMGGESPLETYQVLYLNADGPMRGFVFKNSLKAELHDDLLLCFCCKMEHEFRLVNAIDLYNNYQRFLRTWLERSGYHTMPTQMADELLTLGPSVEIFPMGAHKSQIRLIPYFDKVELYGEIFKDLLGTPDGVNNMGYLMLNGRHGLVKIGRSKRPRGRERTLQGEDPWLELLACWPAPVKQENLLHKHFAAKRERGEWFRLQVRDIFTLKDLLDAQAHNATGPAQ